MNNVKDRLDLDYEIFKSVFILSGCKAFSDI